MLGLYAVTLASLALAHITLAGVMPITHCPNTAPVGDLVHIIIPSCDAPPCILRKGRTYSVEIDFEIGPGRDTNRLDVVVSGIIGGIELPWNGVGKVGCDDMFVGRCPLYAADYVTYGVNLTVLELYPSVNLDIKWKMSDERGDVIWCFLLGASITA